MITVLRLILFFLSSLGSWELLRRKTSVNVLFLPSLTIAVQTGILFLAGIVHCLMAGVIVLLAAGIAGLCYAIIRDRGLSFLKHYLNAGYLFLAAAGIALFIFLYGQIFYHYDNFSHWALVVRQMLLTNHFPDQTDVLIQFRNYPLGSGVFIYFLTRVVGGGEGVMMFAQAYMMLTCMLPLLVFFETKRGACDTNGLHEMSGVQGMNGVPGASCTRRLCRTAAGFLTLLAAANFFLVYNIPVQDLLVDSLLPLTGMCAFVYAWYYRREMAMVPRKVPAHERLAFAGIACYMIQLVQIKNSGWFFAAFLMLWVLIGIRRDRRILARILVAAAPVISAILWWVHCKIAFSGAGTAAGAGKHLVSISYYLKTAGEKTEADIGNICRAFLKFTATWKDIWLTVALAAVVLVLILAFGRKLLKSFGKLMLFSLVLFVIYQGFQLGMYVFSMPAQEAAYLAEAERYTKTILMAVVYLLVLAVMKLIADVQLSEVKAGICALSMTAGTCLYLLVSQGTFFTVFYDDNTYGERDWIEDMVKEYDVPMGKTYCVIPQEDDGYYSSYLMQYLFSTYEVEEFVVSHPSDMDQVTASYIFLVGGGSDAVQEWVQEHFPEQAGNEVIIR